MKYRTRSIALLMALLLAFFVIPFSTVQAAEPNVTVKLTPNVSTLPTSGGSVSFTLTVSSDGPISNISCSGIYTGLISDVGAGGTASKTFSYGVSPSEIGKELSVYISYNYDGGTGAKTASATISAQAGTPKVSLSVEASSKYVEPGSTVTFTYYVQNTGTVALSNITIKDEGVFTGAIQVSQSLPAGGTYTYPKKIVMQDADVTSAATVTATDASGNQVSANISPITVIASPAQLSISATAAKPQVTSDENVTFTITLKNTGNVEIQDVRVLLENGTEIEKGITLGINASYNVEYSTTVAETSSIVFVAEYPCKGERTQLAAAGVPITVTGGFTVTLAATAVPVIASAAPDATTQPADGVIPTDNPVGITVTFPCDFTFTFKITTAGATTLKNIVITEATLGEMMTLDSFAPGENSYDVTTKIEQAGSYTFTLTATDDAGNKYTAVSQPVDLGLYANQPTEPNGKGDFLGTLFKILLIIVGIAAVGCGGYFGYMLLMKKKALPSGRGSKAAAKKVRPVRDNQSDRLQRASQERMRRPRIPGEEDQPKVRRAAADGGTMRIDRVTTPQDAAEQLFGGTGTAAAGAEVAADADAKIYNRRSSRDSVATDPDIERRLSQARSRRRNVSDDTAFTGATGALLFGKDPEDSAEVRRRAAEEKKREERAERRKARGKDNKDDKAYTGATAGFLFGSDPTTGGQDEGGISFSEKRGEHEQRRDKSVLSGDNVKKERITRSDSPEGGRKPFGLFTDENGQNAEGEDGLKFSSIGRGRSGGASRDKGGDRTGRKGLFVGSVRDERPRRARTEDDDSLFGADESDNSKKARRGGLEGRARRVDIFSDEESAPAGKKKRSSLFSRNEDPLEEKGYYVVDENDTGYMADDNADSDDLYDGGSSSGGDDAPYTPRRRR